MGKAKGQLSGAPDNKSPKSPWKLSGKSNYLAQPKLHPAETPAAKKSGGQVKRTRRRTARALELGDLPRPRIGPNNSPASNIYFNFMGQRQSMDTVDDQQDSLRRQQSDASTSQSEPIGARQLSFRSLSDAQSRPPLPAWDSAAESYLGSMYGSQSTTEPNTPAAPDMTAAGPSDRSDSADTRRFESSYSQTSQASLESLREAAQGVSAGLTPTGSVSDDEESDLGTPPHLTPNPSPLRVSGGVELDSAASEQRSRNPQILSLSYLVGADVSMEEQLRQSDDEGASSEHGSASSFDFGTSEPGVQQDRPSGMADTSRSIDSARQPEAWRSSAPSTSEIQPMEPEIEEEVQAQRMPQQGQQQAVGGPSTPEGSDTGRQAQAKLALREYEDPQATPALQGVVWPSPQYSTEEAPEPSGSARPGRWGSPPVNPSPGTERAIRRSLLRRIGKRALRAVHSLSPQLSDVPSTSRDSLSSLSGPASTPEITPRAAYTVTVEGWPSSPESASSIASTQGMQERQQLVGSPVRQLGPQSGLAHSPSPASSEDGRTSYSLSTPPGSPSLSPELSPRRPSGSASKRLLVRLPPVAEERGSSVDHHGSGAADPSSTDSELGSLSPPLVSAATAERLVNIAASFEQVWQESIVELTKAKKMLQAERERTTEKIQTTGPSLQVPFAMRSAPPVTQEIQPDVQAEIQPDTPSPQVEQAPWRARLASPETSEPLAEEGEGAAKELPKSKAKRKGAGLKGRATSDAWGVLALEESGAQYEGQVGRKGMHGLGVLIFKDGGSYAGQWANSTYSGFGIETFSDGSYFVGQLSTGTPHGYGVCNFADGFTYSGTWKHGVQQGKGCQEAEEPGAFFYVGEFLGGLRQGLGVAGFPNGEEYAGEVAQDAPHGYGVAHFEGRKGTYEGAWRNGQRHGWAVSTLPNGSLWAGQWALGKACWLAQLRSTVKDDLVTDFEEAMDFCEEAARLARASSTAALNLANEIREPGGPVQEAVGEASEEAHLAARDAHIVQQKARLLCSRPRIIS